VAPETVDINDGVIVARYKNRRLEASMAEPPSIVKTIEFEIVGGHLEVPQP
jgi:hypothetical protein